MNPLQIESYRHPTLSNVYQVSHHVQGGVVQAHYSYPTTCEYVTRQNWEQSGQESWVEEDKNWGTECHA